MKINFKTTLVGSTALASAVLVSAAFAQNVTGAGASFPAPVYAKWADQYNKATGVKVNS